MPKQNLCIIKLATIAGLLASAAASAAPIPVSFNPQLSGLNGTPFTATKLNLLNYARVDLGATTGNNTAFTETGFLLVNNAQIGSSLPFVLPTKPNTSYSLYIQFTGIGSQTGADFNGSSTGIFSSLSATLFGVNGAATFGLTNEDALGNPTGASQPFITAGSPVAVASGTLIDGTTSFTLNPVGAGANIFATFNPIAGFVTSPTNVGLDLSGAFNNNSQIVTIANNGKTFLLNGGGGDSSFIAVPEPASLAIVGVGMAALGMIRRRRSA